jgi:hypothetical protein
LRTFSQRWNISLGSFAAREGVTPEARDKVAPGLNRIAGTELNELQLPVTTLSTPEPENVATWWPRFWGPSVGIFANTGPESGTHVCPEIESCSSPRQRHSGNGQMSYMLESLLEQEQL